MTPITEMNPYKAVDGKTILFPKLFNTITPKQLLFFKKWAKNNDWICKQTYKFESQKRAFTLTKGSYSISCIYRVTTPVSENNTGGHHRKDGSIIIHSNIACFFNGVNLGQYDIRWHDFITGDVELLIHLRAAFLLTTDKK